MAGIVRVNHWCPKRDQGASRRTLPSQDSRAHSSQKYSRFATWTGRRDQRGHRALEPFLQGQRKAVLGSVSVSLLCPIHSNLPQDSGALTPPLNLPVLVGATDCRSSCQGHRTEILPVTEPLHPAPGRPRVDHNCKVEGLLRTMIFSCIFSSSAQYDQSR